MSTHLSFLVKLIKKLETQNMTLCDSFSLVSELEENINVISELKN